MLNSTAQTSSEMGTVQWENVTYDGRDINDRPLNTSLNHFLDHSLGHINNCLHIHIKDAV